MADSKVYVIAPRKDDGKLCGRVPLPLENTRELEIWYDSSAPYLCKFEFSSGNRCFTYVPSEYHYQRGSQRWVYEVDIDGHAVKIEVAMASAAPIGTYMYPLGELLGCPSAYLTDGVLFVVRLHADECAKSAAPSAQLPPRPAKSTSDKDFLPQYDDELLKLAGLTRQFLHRLWEIVQRRGVVKSAELAKSLKLPKRSQRLGMALSILVQERLIYQKSNDSYSIHPVDYQPAPADMMWSVVKYVCDNPGVETGELAKSIDTNIPHISRIARQLAAQGLIRRQLVGKRRGVGTCATWLHYPAD
jgi:CRP-like cAMP-binding protein